MKAFSRLSSGPPQLMQHTFASTGDTASTFTSAYFASQRGQWNEFARNFSVIEREPNWPLLQFTAFNLIVHWSRHAMVAVPPFGVHMARVLTLALVLLLSIHSAFGQYLTIIQACTRDVTKFCQAAKPQRNILAECIETHFQDFHKQCRTALMQTAVVREACKADIEQQCPAARPGAGRILLCVKKHFTALSQTCKDAIGHAAEVRVGSY